MKRWTAPIRLSVAALLLLAAVFQIHVPAAQSAECSEGQLRFDLGPFCSCSDGRTPRYTFKCIGGEWVFQRYSCGAPMCPE